jgi:hypothetical protein
VPVPVPVPRSAASSSSLVLKVAGALLLVAAAAVAVCAYREFNREILGLRANLARLDNDLRKDMARLSQTNLDMLKKEEYATRLRYVWDAFKDLRDDKLTLVALKERTDLLANLYQASVTERKESLAEVRGLRQQGSSSSDQAELKRQIRELRRRISELESTSGQASMTLPSSQYLQHPPQYIPPSSLLPLLPAPWLILP